MTSTLHDVPVAILRRALSIIERSWPATHADEPVLAARAALQSALGSTGGDRLRIRTLEHDELVSIAAAMSLVERPAERRLDAGTIQRALRMIIGDAPADPAVPGPIAARAMTGQLDVTSRQAHERIHAARRHAVLQVVDTAPTGMTAPQIADSLVASAEFDPGDVTDDLVARTCEELEKDGLILWRGRGRGWVRAERANSEAEVPIAHGPDTEDVNPSQLTETTLVDSPGFPVRAERANPVAAGFLAALQLAVTGDPGPLAELLADALGPATEASADASVTYPYRDSDVIWFNEHLSAVIADIEEFGVTPAVDGVARVFVVVPPVRGGRKARYFLEAIPEADARVYYAELGRIVRGG